MAWHLVTSTHFDFEEFRRGAAADRLPRHFVSDLADHLEATIHQPAERPKRGLFGRLGSMIYGSPRHWDLARSLRSEIAPGDTVYVTGCDAGFPLALCLLHRRSSVGLAIVVVEPGRKRTRAVGWFIAALCRNLVFLVSTPAQAEGLRASFGRRASEVVAVDALVDTNFFRPDSPKDAEAERPLVVSGGAEQRDYACLASATERLDVDVKVCFASPTLSSKTRYSMPPELPENMELAHFELDELRSLYQSADVVVVSVLPNGYSAGLGTVLEAVACQAPVVVTASPGIIDEFIDADLVIGVEPMDVSALRLQIEGVLANPKAARSRAVSARSYLLEHHSADHFSQTVIGALVRLRSQTPTFPESGIGSLGQNPV